MIKAQISSVKNPVFWSFERTPTAILHSPSHLYVCLCPPLSSALTHIKDTVSTRNYKCLPRYVGFIVKLKERILQPYKFRICEQTAHLYSFFICKTRMSNRGCYKIKLFTCKAFTTIPGTLWTLNKSCMILYNIPKIVMLFVFLKNMWKYA